MTDLAPADPDRTDRARIAPTPADRAPDQRAPSDRVPVAEPAVLAARPELAELRAAMLAEVWGGSDVPPRVLELARLRVAALLGDEVELSKRTPAAVEAGVDEDLIRSLPAWATDRRFGPADRAALMVAEQFVLDSHGITDEQIERLQAELGDAKAVGFLTSLALFDGFSRATIALRSF